MGMDSNSLIGNSNMILWTALMVLFPLIGFSFYFKKKLKNKKFHSVANQSIKLKDGSRISHFTKSGNILEFEEYDCRTMYESFLNGRSIAGDDGKCLGIRSKITGLYDWVSYKEVMQTAGYVGTGLANLIEQDGEESNIGIYAVNCPEWVYIDQGCCMYSIVSVPLYDTLGLPACTYIINQTSLSTIACDTTEKAMKLAENKLMTPSLKNIIIFTSQIDEVLKDKAKEKGVTIYTLEDIKRNGIENPKEMKICGPEDIYTICYTSGTTGNPKGVIITHASIVLNMIGAAKQIKTKINPDDAYLSYLPLAHILERCCHVYLFMYGGHIGFYSGDIKLILDDLAALKPAFFVTVPRLLNRIYDKVHQGISTSWLKSVLFRIAMRRKKELLNQGIITNNTIWDKLVFKKVRNLLGGKAKFIMVGGAPTADSVLEFCKIAFGCPVLEGYGQTEACGCSCLTLEHDVMAGSVGPPLPIVMVKLMDVPEMDYFSEEGKGEVCLRGPCCTRGYYKDEAKTKELIDSDNWLHTGDIGCWKSNGSLKIIDRKKDIFKLAQGEYIAPIKIENIYLQSPFLQQIYVDGNGLQNNPIGIVIPDPTYLLPWAENNGFSGKDINQLCEEKGVRDAILENMNNIGKNCGLKGFEMVKNISLLSEPFSIENGYLTTTFKLKRPVIKKYFEEMLLKLYDE